MKQILNHTPEDEKLSFSNILKSFHYWPGLFKLLWETHRGYFFCVLTLNFVNGLLPAALILTIQYLVNTVQNIYQNGYKDDYFTHVLPFFIAFALVTILTGVTGSVLETYKQLYRNLLSNKINVKLIEKAKRLPYSSFENPEIYNKLQRARQDSTYKPFAIFEELMGIIKSGITVISISGILMIWNWQFTLILILLPLISSWSIMKIGKEIFLISHKRAEETRKQFYYYYLLTTDITVKEVKLFGLGNLLLKNYSNMFNRFYLQDRRLLLKKMRIDLFFQLISVAFVMFVQFMVVMDAVTGIIAIGSLIAYFQAVNTTQKTSNELMYMIFNMHQNNLYMTQLFSFLDVPEERDVSNNGDNTYLDSISFEEKGIRFINVSFKYPGQKEYTLKKVNFHIKPGETLALVGSNGSGKSTIVKLITKLYTDFEGIILLDGKPIHQYSTNEWQDKISAIFQDFVRYELDVKDNIGYGDYKKADQVMAIQVAAKKSGALKMINSLPNQMDTQLGKTFANGIQLSGGQWQRIAISRAYMRDASLYILDEPTAALDPEAEEEVFRDFKEITKNCMGLFISHRYSTVRHATKIMVLDKGRVVELGTHNELLKIKGIYARLFELQAKNFIDYSKIQVNV